MSTDYDVGCTKCKEYTHLGQRFSSGWAFGFGSNDKEGWAAVGDFIQRHTGCEQGCVQVRASDALDERFFFDEDEGWRYVEPDIVIEND